MEGGGPKNGKDGRPKEMYKIWKERVKNEGGGAGNFRWLDH